MPSAGNRAAMMIAQLGDLFAYGTLQFPEVLHAQLEVRRAAARSAGGIAFRPHDPKVAR
jgi:hypothetical protein